MTLSAFSVTLVAAVMAAVVGAAVPASAETRESLVTERQKLTEEYRQASHEFRIKKADQKIALEQLKVELQRKRIMRNGPPPSPDPAAGKYREMVQRQYKEILPLERRYKDLQLKLRENELKLRKLKVDEARKGPATQSSPQPAAAGKP